jgi:hypothetical protein
MMPRGTVRDPTLQGSGHRFIQIDIDIASGDEGIGGGNFLFDDVVPAHGYLPPRAR